MTDDLTIRKLDLLIKEVEFLREANLLFAKRQENLINLTQAMRSDIVLLENQNLSRHTEILQILHRLEEISEHVT